MAGETNSKSKSAPPASATVTHAGPPPAGNVGELHSREFGNYEILDEIARGGVGVVYRARQKGLERVVALKVLQGGTMVTSDQVKRFLHEAQAAAKLQHPNIVPIHDFGHQDGQYYFTMDFIEGQSLADRLAHGPLPTREALAITRQVADALRVAHAHNVIHRDIKPGNILIDREGRVKVTDFGLAKELDRDEMHLTVTGQVMGTPRYMSPEQASGKTADADQRSDIFSLGVTLYEMLTGRAAFEAENVMELLTKVCEEEPAPPHKLNRKVHRDASAICLKALEKEKARRYQTAAEWLVDVDRFLAGEPIEAKVVGVLGRTLRKARRAAKVIALNVILVALALYLLLFYLNSRPSSFELRVTPADADIALDGVVWSAEQVAQPQTIPAGKHRLLVALEPDYEPQTIEFETEPAESRQLTVGLVRREGTVVVTTDPPDAAITLVGPGGLRMPLRGPRVEQTLPTGIYGALVHRENHLARDLELMADHQQTNRYHVALPSIKVWSVPANGSVQSVPVVADLDGDEVPEVVIGDDAGNVRCLRSRAGVTQWVRTLDGAVQAPLAVADVSRDGFPEIFAGTTDGKLYCLAAQDGRPVWAKPFQTRGAILSAILLRDLNGDGVADAIFGSGDGAVYAVSGADGTGLWTNRTNGRIDSAIAWRRVGTEDLVFAGSADKKLYALTPATGQTAWQVDCGAPLLWPPQFETLNGQPHILLPTPRQAGDARTRTAVSLTTHQVTGVSDAFPRRLDLTGDGQLREIEVTATGTICRDETGRQELWRSDYIAVGAYVADITHDGVADLIFNNGPDDIVALSGADGHLIGHIKLEAATSRGFALDDVDRDGVSDLIVGAGQQIYCFAWNGGRRQWSARSDGYYDAPFVTAAGRFFAKNNVGEISAHEPAQATRLWTVKTSRQPSPYVGPAVGDGLLVDADAGARRVTAYRIENGQVAWQMKLPTAGDVIGAPAVGEGLAVVSDGVAGLYAFALTNGALRWSVAVSNITVAATIHSNAIWVCGTSGTGWALYCFEARDGKLRWRVPVPEPLPAPVVVTDRDEIIGLCDNGYTYAWDGREGRKLWEYQHADSRTRSGNGVVLRENADAILVNHTGDVICLDARTGQPKWRCPVKEPVAGKPVLADLNLDGVADVIVGTMSRRVYCISGTGAGRLWSYEVGAPIRYCTPAIVTAPRQPQPRLAVGTGPPENALYCLSGSAPPAQSRDWTGPWREVLPR